MEKVSRSNKDQCVRVCICTSLIVNELINFDKDYFTSISSNQLSNG